ncbi:MAG: hypothetical protein HY868_20730 [Chloroflexi bacterium]|nr:hypothetical protein [Chloroflexota bacterium]
MKKIFLLCFILAVIIFPLAGCVPEKPAKDGKGELAVTISREFTAPVTHSPLEWWQARHFQVIDSGDMQEKDCLYCHQTERSCNNCHGYVGVRKIK